MSGWAGGWAAASAPLNCYLESGMFPSIALDTMKFGIEWTARMAFLAHSAASCPHSMNNGCSEVAMPVQIINKDKRSDHTSGSESACPCVLQQARTKLKDCGRLPGDNKIQA